MQITFFGAVREVTGSMHLITTDTNRILLDCGLFQGRRKESAEKNRILPFDPQIITNVILSHAHIDHSGRLPLLAKGHFSGRIISTRATAAACDYLLMDSAHIQESDANYLNYKTVRNCISKMKVAAIRKATGKKATRDIKTLLKKNKHDLDVETINKLTSKLRLDRVQPLYTVADAGQALESFDGYPYRHPIRIGKGITCTLYDAGHILGSAISIINIQENGKKLTIGYTGDIGRFAKPIIRDPTQNFAENDRDLDLMIMESTYGNRHHAPVQDLKPQLRQILSETHERGGSIIIPAFAFGRTQELLYVLHELYKEESVPPFPIYVDSPLATNITRVFGEHPEVYDQETHETFLQDGRNPFSLAQINFVKSVEESMALNRDQKPHIVLSASGMCEAGRILHHLRHKIHDEKNTILIVGYMAQHTLGRRILDQGLEYEASGRKGPAPVLKFYNKSYPLRARVVSLGGFSAHGDQAEMLTFLKNANLSIQKIAVVHGEEDQSLSFAETLNQNGYQAMVPQRGETIELK